MKPAFRFDVRAIGGDMVTVDVTVVRPPVRPARHMQFIELGTLTMSYANLELLQALRSWGQKSPGIESETYFHGDAKAAILIVAGLIAGMGVSMPHLTSRADCCDGCVAKAGDGS